MAGPYTIGNEEWEYLQTLNMCIQLLLVISLGILAGYLKIFDAATFVPETTTFVFYVALPCLVLNALGIKIDLYDDKNIWEFISAFLILRGIALVIAIVAVAVRRSKGVGYIAVWWLAMTWISTVILGVPIAGAVFDNPMKGAKYGILAGISSFIFQLPFMLFFLECHQLEEEYLTRTAIISDLQVEPDPEVANVVNPTKQIAPLPMSPLEDDGLKDVQLDQKLEMEPCPHKEIEAPDELETSRLCLWTKFGGRKDVWIKILKQVMRNPVLWSIAGGFFLTLTTLGPTYLNDMSEDFVPGLGWISTTLLFLGNTVTPISLFTMGVWMQAQGRDLFRMNPISALACMISKLIVVPLVMVGLASALDLGDEGGRAAVLIAALPISMASFSLANRYGIGEAIMAENVALGTLLILPTVILWNLVMDEVGLFPISK